MVDFPWLCYIPECIMIETRNRHVDLRYHLTVFHLRHWNDFLHPWMGCGKMQPTGYRVLPFHTSPWCVIYIFLVGDFNPSEKIIVKYSQIGSFPQVGVKIKHIWNHHWVLFKITFLRERRLTPCSLPLWSLQRWFEDHSWTWERFS